MEVENVCFGWRILCSRPRKLQKQYLCEMAGWDHVINKPLPEQNRVTIDLALNKIVTGNHGDLWFSDRLLLLYLPFERHECIIH